MRIWRVEVLYPDGHRKVLRASRNLGEMERLMYSLRKPSLLLGENTMLSLVEEWMFESTYKQLMKK